MDLSARPVQKPGYHLESIDGELLLYHLDQTLILYCNQTASLIWHLCDGQRTIGEIVTLLREAYPEASGTMASEVEETLRQFADAGCLQLT